MTKNTIPMPSGDPIMPYGTPEQFRVIADHFTRQHIEAQLYLDELYAATPGHPVNDLGGPACSCDLCGRKGVAAGNVWLTDFTMRQALMLVRGEAAS